jgi:hypothetical protein
MPVIVNIRTQAGGRRAQPRSRQHLATAQSRQGNCVYVYREESNAMLNASQPFPPSDAGIQSSIYFNVGFTAPLASNEFVRCLFSPSSASFRTVFRPS